MGNPYLGEIRIVGFSFAPPGWLACNGQTLSISENDALFNLIGTTYGGDGQNNFNLPNLQSRVPVHQGTDSSGSSYPLGSSAGSESVTLNSNTLGSHAHPFQASSATGGATAPTNAYPAASQNTAAIYINDPANKTVAFANNAITPTGSGGPHNNIMPYQCVNFIIATEGIYPTQS